MPQQQKLPFDPEYIIGIILKRRWLIIIPFCISIMVGCYLAMTLPKKYQASTMIMVQAQRVPDSYVQSVVNTDISSRLNTITQQVLSRTNIERIIDTYQLFEGPEYEDMYLEDKVNSVRNRISVNVKKSSSFSISYTGVDPEKVKNITNSLATFFIDENLKVRESQATGTSDFLDDELSMMRQRLEQSEQEYREYRQKYMGELPEQLDANLNFLTSISQEILEKQKAIQETTTAIAILENQIAETKETSRNAMGSLSDTSDEAGDLTQLQAQLEALRAKYTENHPSIIRLKSMISKLDASTAAEGNGNEGADLTSGNSGTSMTRQEKQLELLKFQVQNMEAEIADLKKKSESYQARVENTPKREEELLSIKRDYDNLQDMYNSLLNRRLEAEISVNMEKKQKGEQFEVIDSASLPQKPISPNMKILFLGSLALGLGFGGGITYLIEFMNKSFTSIEDVESNLGLTVLATIPAVLHPKDLTRRRLNNIFSMVSVLFSLFLLAGFAFIALNGTDFALNLIKKLT